MSQEHWYAVKSRAESRLAEELASEVTAVFLPQESVQTAGGKTRLRPAIPHVLFIRATGERALALEKASRGETPFWIYRYPQSTEIQPISQRSIDLLRLLTAEDTHRCRIYTAEDYVPGQRVRVTGGLYAGYEGAVKRIGRDRHVIVALEGLCLVILPYIHPDLLQPL